METFGPVAAIEVVDSRRRRSQRANATAYGLSSGIITQRRRARHGSSRRRSTPGIVHVNDQPVGDEPQMPFGGVKDSGFGTVRRRRRSWTSSRRLRWITVQRGSHPFPF